MDLFLDCFQSVLVYLGEGNQKNFLVIFLFFLFFSVIFLTIKTQRYSMFAWFCHTVFILKKMLLVGLGWRRVTSRARAYDLHVGAPGFIPSTACLFPPGVILRNAFMYFQLMLKVWLVGWLGRRAHLVVLRLYSLLLAAQGMVCSAGV